QIKLVSSDPSVAIVGDGNTVSTLKSGSFFLSARLSRGETVSAEKLIRVVQPSSLSVDKNICFLTPGNEGIINYTVFDQDGIKLDGIKPVVSAADTSVVVITGIYPGSVSVKAKNTGKTSLSLSVPGDRGIEKSVDIEVTKNLDPVEVSVLVKMNGTTLLPRRTYRIRNTDINPWIENNAGENLVEPKDYVNIADVIASVFLTNGFTGGGKSFRYRKDSYSGNRLYLWQVGNNWEYVYGWGGSNELESFRQCWVVMVNDTFYFNDLDFVRVKDGDAVSVFHIDDIYREWETLMFVSDRYIIDQGDTVSLSWDVFTCGLTETGEPFVKSGSIPSYSQVYSNDVPLGTIGELAGGGMQSMLYSPAREGSYDLRIEGYQGDVVRIVAGTITGEESDAISHLTVYPNPFSDYITVRNPAVTGYNCMVTDISGRVLASGTNRGVGEMTIPTGNLSRGMYIIVIRYPDNKIEKRIVVKP
ncbi:MAG TPA: T9SS type A sorting domain-containing protein, partial [Bacteroidales bacterium]|nr:T9SS type A sorting domain-containing protein [Bacteroidales bacterium]